MTEQDEGELEAARRREAALLEALHEEAARGALARAQVAATQDALKAQRRELDAAREELREARDEAERLDEQRKLQQRKKHRAQEDNADLRARLEALEQRLGTTRES